MSDGDVDTPAERRLLEHLDGLREHPPEPAAGLVASVVRTARWQGAVRPYLRAVGALLAAAHLLVEPRNQR